MSRLSHASWEKVFPAPDNEIGALGKASNGEAAGWSYWSKLM
jgi:hypothetical protein